MSDVIKNFMDEFSSQKNYSLKTNMAASLLNQIREKTFSEDPYKDMFRHCLLEIFDKLFGHAVFDLYSEFDEMFDYLKKNNHSEDNPISYGDMDNILWYMEYGKQGKIFQCVVYRSLDVCKDLDYCVFIKETNIWDMEEEDLSQKNDSFYIKHCNEEIYGSLKSALNILSLRGWYSDSRSASYVATIEDVSHITREDGIRLKDSLIKFKDIFYSIEIFYLNMDYIRQLQIKSRKEAAKYFSYSI